MSSVIEFLKAFNRKERFFLVADALGKPDFELSPEFKQKLERALGLRVPNDAFVAMDYHLSWIYAAVVLGAEAIDLVASLGTVRENSEGLIRGNQEDVDLLVAYEDDQVTHLVVVEAKGVTGWTNGQMTSKATRLGLIFGQDGSRYPSIAPHFIITSPWRARDLRPAEWPKWMAPDSIIPWMPLPVRSGLLRPGRTDSRGTHWKVFKERDPNLVEDSP